MTVSQSVVPTKPGGAGKESKGLGLRRREAKWGLIFLSPWLLGFLIFTLLPMLASLTFSFTNYNPTKPAEMSFVGLSNYARLFNDVDLLQAISVTLRFALISVPLSLIFPLLLALLVNSKHLLAKNVFRTLFYMPYMIPVVAGVMVFGGVLNSESGWLNRLLAMIGIQGPNWFQDANWVLPALVIMGFWGVGNTMLTMLSGLQNVPTEMYEAAKVDGANAFVTFFKITIPMISPVVFYNLILSLIGTFQYFTQAYVISNGRGDPGGATLFYNLYLYKTAFAFLDMGYGSTLAWAMFIVVLLLTVFLFQTQKRWVYYAGGED
ncbi:MAG TPA: sugar ABC transporter permease [Anaerolineaceae bacterium]|nr:sugar ABC transporter permease [Anaerolineaceae bacterium]HPN50731.1 sugar ABC transporter permease [Anaerolineaceae bacterium]